MSELVLVDSDAFKRIEDVAELHVQGLTPYKIAQHLGIKQIEVKRAIEQWRVMLQKDSEANDLARDHLNKLVVHYDRLIEESYKILSDLNLMVFDEKVSAQKNTTLKNISEYEAKRVDALQKAGLLDAADLGDELAYREEREAQILDILRNHICDNCKPEVAYQLRKLNDAPEPVDVQDVEFDE